MRALWLAVLLLLGGAFGCAKHKPSAERGNSRGASTESTQPAKAVVEGVIRLAPGAELPSYAPEQMEKKLFQKLAPEAPPATCTPPKKTDRQPVRLTADGALAGVMLAPSGFSHQPQRLPVVHEVVIDDCRLNPSLVVAMKGDSLRVSSKVSFPFMPSYESGPGVRSLIPGQTYDVPLNKPGVSPLLCGFTAPCGRTDVIVLLHPIYAITDAQGKFRFDDFPAGEQVSLSAWHPLFQESKIALRVEPGEHKQVELVLTPAPPLPQSVAPAVEKPPAGSSVHKTR
ncbi:MAG: hypothetical protein ACHQ53_15175 [Polyangiales bacterium]